MIFKTSVFKLFFGVFITLVVTNINISVAKAQFDSEPFYEVVAKVPVVKNNFVKARAKAVKIALKSALKQDLLDFLGEEEFDLHRHEIQKILRKSEKYVKSYRFLEANDDLIEQVSQVKLEVILFHDAVNNHLSRIGVKKDLEGGKQVVILLDESGLGYDRKVNFWSKLPISETALTRYFIEEGIPVVRRSFFRYAISEETVVSAMKGDLSAAVDIGLKAGADIVILGSATTTLVKDDSMNNQQPVRVAISVKAISSHYAKLIAAKSDFATVVGKEALVGERQAFQYASKKLIKFLIPAIQRHWGIKNKSKELKHSKPVPQNNLSPLPWSDL